MTTFPFTDTKPIAICSSASLREQIPERAMNLFKRISYGFDFFGAAFFSTSGFEVENFCFFTGAFPLEKLFPFSELPPRLDWLAPPFCSPLAEGLPLLLLP